MPTLKQKLAAHKLSEIIRNPDEKKTMGNVLMQAGYSSSTSLSPTIVTERKGWKELMEDYLPDDKLLETHNKALQATKWNDFTGEREEDHTTRLKAVDLGYKIKGKLSPENALQINIGGDMGIKFTKREE